MHASVRQQQQYERDTIERVSVSTQTDQCQLEMTVTTNQYSNKGTMIYNSPKSLPMGKDDLYGKPSYDLHHHNLSHV